MLLPLQLNKVILTLNTFGVLLSIWLYSQLPDKQNLNFEYCFRKHGGKTIVFIKWILRHHWINLNKFDLLVLVTDFKSSKCDQVILYCFHRLDRTLIIFLSFFLMILALVPQPSPWQKWCALIRVISTTTRPTQWTRHGDVIISSRFW